MPRGLLGKAGAYIIGTGLNSAIPFLLLPVFTHFLSPAEMGNVAMFQSVLAILSIIVTMYLPGATSVRYFKREGVDLSVFMGTGVLLSFGISFATFGIGYLIRDFLFQTTNLSFQIFFLTTICAFCQVILSLQLKLFQMRGEAVKFSISQNLNTILIMAVSIILVITSGWEGRIWGQFIAMLLTGIAIISWLSINGTIRIAWRREYVVDLLRFGLPLVPHGLGAVATVFATRLVLKTMTDMHEVGLYMVAAQLASTLTIVASAFNQAYAPWLYRRLATPYNFLERRRIVKNTYWSFGAIIFAAGIFIALAPAGIRIFLSSDYIGLHKYIPWLAAGSAFNCMYFLVTNYLFYHQKTGRLATASVTLGGFGVILSIFLIRHFGSVGAAQAFMVTNGLLFLATWWLAIKVEPMPWLLKENIHQRKND